RCSHSADASSSLGLRTPGRWRSTSGSRCAEFGRGRMLRARVHPESRHLSPVPALPWLTAASACHNGDMSNTPEPSPYGPSQTVYQQVVRPPSNGMAVTALVLGIVAITVGVWSIIPVLGLVARSEERRVGKECGSRWWRYRCTRK